MTVLTRVDMTGMLARVAVTRVGRARLRIAHNARMLHRFLCSTSTTTT